MALIWYVPCQPLRYSNGLWDDFGTLATVGIAGHMAPTGP